jgi:hypothetical protein
MGIYRPASTWPTVTEIAQRFGEGSEVRRAEMESIRWLIALAGRAGAQRLIINGSFTSDKLDPNDVDCVLLIGADYPREAQADAELHAGVPFVEVKRVRQDQFDLFVNEIYGTDRNNIPKGMIEVVL